MQFRVFLGLIGSVQPPAVRRAQAALNQAMAAQAEHDDDDDEEHPDGGDGTNRPPSPARLPPVRSLSDPLI